MRPFPLVILLALALASCGRTDKAPSTAASAAAAAKAAAPTLLLAPEDVLTLKSGVLAS